MHEVSGLLDSLITLGLFWNIPLSLSNFLCLVKAVLYASVWRRIMSGDKVTRSHRGGWLHW